MKSHTCAAVTLTADMIMSNGRNKVDVYSLWVVEGEYVLLSLGSLNFPRPSNRS